MLRASPRRQRRPRPYQAQVSGSQRGCGRGTSQAPGPGASRSLAGSAAVVQPDGHLPRNGDGPPTQRREVPGPRIRHVWLGAVAALVAFASLSSPGLAGVTSQGAPSSSVQASAVPASTTQTPASLPTTRAGAQSVSSIEASSSVAPSSADPSTVASLVDAGGVQLFPAPLVGAVPAAEVPVERQMTNLYMTASTEPARPQVVVQFKAPFALPARQWRVSVVVGDPGGAQLRASLVYNGAGVVSWKAEKAPMPPTGAAWNYQPVWSTIEANDTDARFSASGMAVVALPLAQAPEGQAVWAEVETGNDGRQLTVSPYYSRAAMFGEVPMGQLPSAGVGAVTDADGNHSGQFVSLPAGPVLSLENKAIKVRFAETEPTMVAGQKVTKAYDFIRIAPTFNKRAVVTDVAFIDRTAGEIKLLDGFSVPPLDKSDGGRWLASGLAPGAPSGPATLQLDLAGVAQALGFEWSPSASGLGVRREYVLDDGRHVVGEAVLATVSWLGADQVAGLDQASVPDSPPVQPLLDQAQDATAPQSLTLIGLAVVAAVLVLASVALTVRRRRRRARGDAADQLTALASETRQRRAVIRHERETGQVPVVADLEPADRPGEGESSGSAEPARSPTDPGPLPDAPPVGPEAEDGRVGSHLSGKRPIDAEPVWADARTGSGERPLIDAPTVKPLPRPQAEPAEPGHSDQAVVDVPGPPTPEPRSTPRSGQPSRDGSPGSVEGSRVSPNSALATLGAEFDELSSRLDKLGEDEPENG